MKIKEITYYDHELKWGFEPIHFNHSLTLLVGVSGVGKTQIINAITRLKKIADGTSVNGIEWKITFLTRNNIEYCWEGRFEAIEDSILDDEDDEVDCKIVYEYIHKNGNMIVDRTDEKIMFNGTKTPKLSSFQSIVEILSEEEDIAPIQEAFERVIYSDDSKYQKPSLSELMIEAKSNQQKFTSLEDLKETNLPIGYKLTIAYEKFTETFTLIKERFTEIFSQVEDLKIDPIPEKRVPIFLRKIVEDINPIIYIKEKNVKNWIEQPFISSGMMKTLMHIAELYLLPEGSLVLIDEFENSLGTNCLDILTEDLLNNEQNLQFIITSHHPYIINNIGMEYWKIVTRKAGVVKVRDAREFNLGKSKHQAFIQLINLEEFVEGIEV